MRHNPNLTRRKPVPDYSPSSPNSPAPAYYPSTNTPPSEKDDNVSPVSVKPVLVVRRYLTASSQMFDEKRQKLVFRRQHRQQRLQQAHNLMVDSSLTLVISGMLETGTGADSEVTTVLSWADVSLITLRHLRIA